TEAYEEKLKEFEQERAALIEQADALISKARNALQLSGEVALGRHFKNQYDEERKFHIAWVWFAFAFLLIALGIGIWITVDAAARRRARRSHVHLARVSASSTRRFASSAPSHSVTFTHLPGSRSL